MTKSGQTIFKPALAKDIFSKKIIFKMLLKGKRQLLLAAIEVLGYQF